MIASTSSADIRLKLFAVKAGIVTFRITSSEPSILTVPSASPDRVSSNASARLLAVVAEPAVVADVAVVADPAAVA